MSDPEGDRRDVQQQYQVNPNLTHVNPNQVGSQDRANTINAEIDRLRQQDEQRHREQQGN
ncbi:MAG: hypothetical protein H6873_01130 [Hyphomicrobiaceae bacterium]|nr:hypothetical protein [Hyphomicrobiaceae bacterium]